MPFLSELPLFRLALPPMPPSFSGSLNTFNLSAVFALLATSRKSGCLRISDGRWTATVTFDRGHAVGATFGDATGLPALEVAALALPSARFLFEDGVDGDRNITAPQEMLTQHLAGLASLRLSLGLPKVLLEAIACPVDAPVRSGKSRSVQLDLNNVRVLSEVNGMRTIEEIVERRGTAEVVIAIVALVEQRVIVLHARRAIQRQFLNHVRYWWRASALAMLAGGLLWLNVASSSDHLKPLESPVAAAASCETCRS
jgi:hypothetical protein